MAPYADYTDDQIKSEIKEIRAALRKMGTGDIAVVAGEGRRIEYGPGDAKILKTELRELAAEARDRGMAIGGEYGAIGVEFR